MKTTMMMFAVLLLIAGPARAGDWEGTWKTATGEERTLTKQGPLLALDVTLADVDARAFHLKGAPAGSKLHLEGRLDPTAGFTGALSGEKSSGKKHTLVLDAELDATGSRADVKVQLDGAERSPETWSRGGLEIVALEADGGALGGTLDVKRSKTGLIVRYRVHGAALAITASVRPTSAHPYADFYSGPLVRSELGTIQPGDGIFKWDGRDETSAKRIALGGEYAIVLEAGAASARATVQVAAARFEAIGSKWPEGDGHKAWDPSNHLQLAAAVLFAGPKPGAPSFSFDGVTTAKSEDDVKAKAVTAASILFSTHGNEGLLTVRGDLLTQRYEPSKLFGRDLKDVHFAFASACYSGVKSGGQSVLKQLIAAGCDVAVGFSAEVDIAECDDFELVTLALLARGAPIEKAARDAGAAISKTTYSRGSCAPIQGATIVVERAPRIDETESLYPPRYGCSTN